MTMEPIPSTVLKYLSLRIQAMTDAMLKGDPRSVAHVYADNALLTDLKDLRVEGRAAIDQHWQNLPRYQTWQLDVLESGGDAETPHQRLHSMAHMKIKGQEYVDEGFCFVVWKKQDDGEYRIYTDVYHPIRFEKV